MLKKLGVLLGLLTMKLRFVFPVCMFVKPATMFCESVRGYASCVFLRTVARLWWDAVIELVLVRGLVSGFMKRPLRIAGSMSMFPLVAAGIRKTASENAELSAGLQSRQLL